MSQISRRNFCKKAALLPCLVLPLGADEAQANWLLAGAVTVLVEIVEVLIFEGAEARVLAAAGEAAVGMAVEETAVLAARSAFLKAFVKNSSKVYDGFELYQKLASISPELPESYIRHQNVINTVFERGDNNRQHRLILTVANNSNRHINAIMRAMVIDMDSGAVELDKAYRVQSPPLYSRKFQAQIVQFASSGAKTLHIATSSSNIQVPDNQSFFVI